MFVFKYLIFIYSSASCRDKVGDDVVAKCDSVVECFVVEALLLVVEYEGRLWLVDAEWKVDR